MTKFIDKPVLNYFDGGFPSMSVSLMTGSNVYNLGGYSNSSIKKNNDLEAVSYNCIYYGQLVNAVYRLSDYRNYDLVEAVLDLYSDAINSIIDFNTDKLVEVEGDEQATEILNRRLKEIKYLSIFKSDIKDLIFYSSVAHKLIKENDKFKIKDLRYPFTTGWYKEDRKYVVQADSGPKFTDDLLRFSFDDLALIIDDTFLQLLNIYDQEKIDEINRNKNNIFSQPKLICSKPLFLSTELKLKDYVLKDLISAFLSLINLIEQDTYTIDGARITDTDNLIKLCERIKGLLVTKDDMNLLASTRLDKNALIRRLFDRARVIPSIAGALNNMQKLQVSDMRDKLDAINNQKETVRDELLTTIGFPLDLLRGSTNKWEVGRQNDRYSIKILNIKTAANLSTISNAETIAKMEGIYKEGMKIKVLFLKDTPYEIQNSITDMNNNKEYLQSLQDIIRTAIDIVESEIPNKENLTSIVNKLLLKAGIDVKIEPKPKEEPSTPSDTI